MNMVVASGKGTTAINVHQFGLRGLLPTQLSIYNKPLDEIAFSNLLSTRRIPLFEPASPVKMRILLMGEDNYTIEATLRFFNSRGVDAKAVTMAYNPSMDKMVMKTAKLTGNGIESDILTEYYEPGKLGRVLLSLGGFDYIRTLHPDYSHSDVVSGLVEAILNTNGLLFTNNVNADQRQQIMYQKTYSGIQKTVANFFDEHD